MIEKAGQTAKKMQINWLASHQATASDFAAWKEASLRKEEEKRQAEKALKDAEKTPARFRGKSFDDFLVERPEQAKVKNVLVRFVETFSARSKEGTNGIFKGNPGTGKTMLAHIINQALSRAGYHVQHEPSLEFLQNLIETKFQSQENFEARMQSLKRPHLLIIDEATESMTKDGKPSEIERQLLFMVINSRYENNLCTLIVTNRNNDELLVRLGEPIIGRLVEKGISLSFNWPSHRQKQGK